MSTGGQAMEAVELIILLLLGDEGFVQLTVGPNVPCFCHGQIV